MKFEDVKKWWPMFLVAVPLVALASYVVVWMDRAGCANTPLLKCWLTAVAVRYADFIWFGWVRDYQVLVAGLLTFAAGAFVIGAAIHTRATTIDDRKNDRKRRIVAALNEVIMSFEKCYLAVSSNEFDRVQIVLDAIELCQAKLADGAAPVGNVIPYITDELRDITLRLAKKRPMLPGDTVTEMLANARGLCLLGSTYFSPPSRFFNEKGVAIHMKRSLTDFDRGRFETAGIAPEHVSYATDLLDLDV